MTTRAGLPIGISLEGLPGEDAALLAKRPPGRGRPAHRRLPATRPGTDRTPMWHRHDTGQTRGELVLALGRAQRAVLS